MGKQRVTPEQIIIKLRKIEVFTGQGTARLLDSKTGFKVLQLNAPAWPS